MDVQDAVVPLDQPESFEEDSVRHCEDRRVNSNTQGEHPDGRGRESGCLDKLAQCKSKIEPHRFNP